MIKLLIYTMNYAFKLYIFFNFEDSLISCFLPLTHSGNYKSLKLKKCSLATHLSAKYQSTQRKIRIKAKDLPPQKSLKAPKQKIPCRSNSPAVRIIGLQNAKISKSKILKKQLMIWKNIKCKWSPSSKSALNRC